MYLPDIENNFNEECWNFLFHFSDFLHLFCRLCIASLCYPNLRWIHESMVVAIQGVNPDAMAIETIDQEWKKSNGKKYLKRRGGNTDARK